MKSFQKNKPPGNDGLTVEFDLTFWDLVGKCPVNALHFAQEQGQLSTSQKQAMLAIYESLRIGNRCIKPLTIYCIPEKPDSKIELKSISN